MNKSDPQPAAIATQTAGDVRAYAMIILGAGYAGRIAAPRLGRRKLELREALVNPRTPFLERVRLHESLFAPVAPRILSMSAFFAGTNIEVHLRQLTVAQCRAAAHSNRDRRTRDFLVTPRFAAEPQLGINLLGGAQVAAARPLGSVALHLNNQDSPSSLPD